MGSKSAAAVVLDETDQFAVCLACVRSRGLCEKHARLIGRMAQLPWWKFQGEALVEQKRLQHGKRQVVAARDRVTLSGAHAAHLARKSAARIAAQRKRRQRERGTTVLGLAAAVLHPLNPPV